MTLTNKKNNNNRKIWIGAAVVLALLIAAAVIKGRGEKKGTEVTVEKVARRTIIQTVTATGKVYPETEVSITSDVSGTIVELYVQEGDSVREGQLLCKINADLILPGVERAENTVKSSQATADNLRYQLKQSETNLANLRETLRRQEQLFKDGVISQQDLDNARTSVSAAEATADGIRRSISAAEFNVQSASATVKESRENLRRTMIYAPCSGVVSKLNKKKGEQVVGTIQMAGTEIMRIANLNAIEVRVDVSENDILHVSKGDTAIIEVDAYTDRKFKGVVTHIANSASNVTDNSSVTGSITSDKVTNFIVKIHLLQSSYTDLVGTGRAPFLPGMSASADIRTETLASVLSVPIQAVTTREGDSTKVVKTVGNSDIQEIVFLSQVDSVSKAVVKTGIQDDRYIQILSGIQEGQEVVTGPYSVVSRKLNQGSRIKVVTEAELYKKKED